jgi:cytosine/adenosine deaminase-related metal-dependent hydrolase
VKNKSILIRNANVLDYLPTEMDAQPAPRVELTDLRISGDKIVARGQNLEAIEGEEVRDINGRTIMPGLINGHHHLYSTLAPGMPAPKNTPRSFQDVLTEIWWKLDRCLDHKAVYKSAVAGAWDAMRCGTTMIFDHHSSLTCVSNSLDEIERGISEAGIRGCLCYEITDRGGLGSRDTTLDENRRYFTKEKSSNFRAIIGAHAGFTLEDRTLVRLQELTDELDCGIHIHLAEGTTDRGICIERGWEDPVSRLDKYGLLRPDTILAHCVDITDAEMALLDERGSWLVHNGRSNMNNSVGRAPVNKFPARSCFGTDGLDGNMWGELRSTFYRGNEAGEGELGLRKASEMWIGGYQMAREFFGEAFGSLDVGAPADFLICNEDQKTPLHSDNWLGMLLFAFHPWDILEVWCGGNKTYRRGDKAPFDGKLCRDAAQRIWDGMEKL